MDGADVELLPYSAKVLGSILTIGVVHMEFVCFPCDHVDFPGSFSFLLDSKDVQVNKL